MANKKHFIKNEKQILYMVLTVLIIFLFSTIFYLAGESEGYNKSQKEYKQLNKQDITEYDLYIDREKIKNASMLLLAAGLFLGFAIHGFAIITVNK